MATVIEYILRILGISFVVAVVVVVYRVRSLYAVPLALGGVCLGLVQVWTPIESVTGPLPVTLFQWCLGIGVVGSLVGVIGLLRHEVLPKTRSRAFLERILRRSRYRCRRARGPDLQTICELAAGEFGTTVSPLQSVQEWHAKNSDVFWILEAVDQSPTGTIKTRVVGYFCLLPLTKRAVALVMAETLSGVNIRASDIVKKHGRVAGLYIGGVAGLTWRAEGVILAHLYEAVHRYCKTEIRLLGRPVTDDGLRLAKKFGFTPVNSSIPFGTKDRAYSSIWLSER